MNAKNPHRKLLRGIALAACSFAVSTDSEIQLLPAGEFRAVDGRPEHAKAWVVNAEIAAKLVAQNAALTNPLVIDYEHQTFLSAENGQPAIAAGWITAMRWEEPSASSAGGLFATVEWTARAKQHIAAHEYKYISPVFAHDKDTGVITKIINAALTNNPAIDGMEEVSARLTAELNQPQENTTMDLDELIERIRYLLNLPALSTPEQVAAELQKAVDLIKAGEADVVAANSLGVVGLVMARAQEITQLKAAKPNPAEYVPVAVMQSLQTELAMLRSEQTDREVNEVITAALTSKHLLPAQEAWARELGKTNIALLRQHVAAAQPIAALSSTQTNGMPPAGVPQGELSENEIATCRMLGVSAEDFKKTRAAGMVA